MTKRKLIIPSILILIAFLVGSNSFAQDDEINNNSESYEQLINRGNVFRDKGELNRALKAYELAAQINPKEPLIYYNRAIVYQKKNDFDNAIADYSEAIRLKPDFIEAYNNRGSLFQSQGRLDKAISDLTKAIELSQYNLFIGSDLKPTHIKRDVFVPLDPGEKEKKDAFQVMVLINRGNAFSLKKMWENAAKDYEQALKINPRLVETEQGKVVNGYLACNYNNQAYEYYANGEELDKALVLIDKAIILEPKNGIFLGTKAEIFYKMGKYKEGLEFIKKALQFEPNHPELLKDLKNIENAILDKSR